MLLDIPDIKGHEHETLYIIGNGFDSAHRIKSSYWQFHEWLIENGHRDFVKTMEGMYNEENRSKFSDSQERVSLLWTDFEKALGQIDAWSVQHMLVEQYENITRNRDTQRIAARKIKTTVDAVSTLIKEWAESIDIRQAKRQFNLSKESKYLTFNYTLTLEKCYHIDGSQICHIHNRVRDKEDKKDKGDDVLVVGCASDVQRTIYGNVGERQLGRKVNAELNRLNKPSDDIIDENDEFFRSLHTIERVVVIGHSMTEIDKPYLDQVRASVNKDAHWHFSAFKEEDYRNVMAFIAADADSENEIGDNVHYIFNIQQIAENEATGTNETQKNPMLEERTGEVIPQKKARHKLTIDETTAMADKYRTGFETDTFTAEDKDLMRKIHEQAKQNRLAASPAGILDKCLLDVDLQAEKEDAIYYCRFVDAVKQQLDQIKVMAMLDQIFAWAYRLRKLEKLGFIKYGVFEKTPIVLLNKIDIRDKTNERLGYNPIPIPEELVTIISRDSQLDVEVQDILSEAVENNFESLKSFIP